MIKCNICNKEFNSNKSISYHFSKIHNLDYIEYLVNNNLLSIPKCVECGNFIDVITKGSRGRVKILNNPSELLYCSNECKLKNEKYRDKMSNAGKIGYQNAKDKFIYTDDRKLNISKKTKETWKNKEIRESRIKSMKEYEYTDSHKENISKSLKGIKKSKSHRDKISYSITEKYMNGEYFNTKILFKSSKLNKELRLMSSYEFKFAFILDNMKSIKKYKYQPFYLKSVDGKRYIPDFYFEMNNKKYLVEIDKYKGFKKKYGYGWKLDLASEWCKNANVIFLYMDINDINQFFIEYFDNDISNINMEIQDSNYAEYMADYISDLLTLKPLMLKFKQIDMDLDYKIPDFGDYVYNKNFGNNNRFIFQFYNNLLDCKWGVARFTPNQAINYKVTLRTIIKNILKRNKKLNYDTFIKQILQERYIISFFNSNWAYWIYSNILKDKNNISILDISGGFGGRLLGFYMFLNDKNVDYDYDYIDLNEETCQSTENFVEYLGMRVNIINSKFEESNVFDNKYDLMFTSIPYYDVEVYNDVDMQKEYRDKNDFIEKFINSIFKLNCETIVVNISEKYKDILYNEKVNLLEYRLNKTMSIELNKHPFLKDKEPNRELFYIYNKKGE